MTKKKPHAKVAVITRTKDRSLLLKRALKSVQSQTYKDFIHVIVNDGGDRAELDKVLGEFPANNRMVVDNPEPDLVKALNMGITAVSSDYIAILDDDDTWPPERLKKTVPYLDETGEKAVVVKMETVVEEIRQDKIVTISRALHPESGEGEISLFKQCHKNYLSNAVITYRREVYDELGGYDETLPVAEDWDFGIRLMLKYDVAFLRNEGPLAFYHQRPGQKGMGGNSVHARVAQQERTINILRNRYLREDLRAGKLGVGYVMNKTEHDLLSVVRLEGHMNHVGDDIKGCIRQSINVQQSLPQKIVDRIRRRNET